MAFVVLALVTPLVHVYDARTDANLSLRLKPPTAAHPFGTDSLGRDILVRILHATRVSLGLAISAVAVAAVLGSAIGFLAGYLRGRVDLVVMFCMIGDAPIQKLLAERGFTVERVPLGTR